MTKCELIAEIGWNHMGDMNLAEKMISEATKSGADYCKFQTWKVDSLKSGPWDNDGRLEIYKKAELTKEKHKKLLEICKKNKINFMTSVFNIKDLEFVASLSNEIVKIPSHEVYNIELIKEAQNLFKTVIISYDISLLLLCLFFIQGSGFIIYTVSTDFSGVASKK